MAREENCVIHVIGDSHSLTYDHSQQVTPHWMGALTAHNIMHKQLVLDCITNGRNTRQWFFQFGEIDCRMHFYHLHKISNKPIEHFIEQTVEKYLTFINILRDNYNVSVMETPPQGLIGNVYAMEHYTDQRERQQIANLFNETLHTRCVENGIVCVNIYPTVTEPLGAEFFEHDMAHIKHTIASGWIDEYLARVNA